MGDGGDALGSLAGAALGSALEWGTKKVNEASHSHPKTEERITEIDTYVADEYSGAAAPAWQVESWEAAKDVDATADILENYIAAIQAKEKLAGGDAAAARTLAKTGVSGPTKAHAYPNYVDAAVQMAGGGTAAALTDYQTALAGPEPAGAIYTEAAALYLQTGKNDKAVEVIESGYTRLQEPPSLTVPLIRTYRLVRPPVRRRPRRHPVRPALARHAVALQQGSEGRVAMHGRRRRCAAAAGSASALAAARRAAQLAAARSGAAGPPERAWRPALHQSASAAVSAAATRGRRRRTRPSGCPW